MKILIVSTLKRTIDPNCTASRSRIIYELATGLNKKKHSVTLLGTADSFIPGVKIVPAVEKSWIDSNVENPYFKELADLIGTLKKIVSLEGKFDIIHNHLFPEFLTPLIERELHIPLLTTLHIEAVDYIDNALSLFPQSFFITVSESQRKLFKKTKILKTVYNGIDVDRFSFSSKKEDYLLWLGRLTKEKNKKGDFIDPKGVRYAIRFAQETNKKLLLSGTIHSLEAYKKDVEPFLNDKIRWIGPLTQESPLTQNEVKKLMQKATAFLMTVNWEEPFGLVMAEAMSCGTPVIGFNRGSVPEIVVDGKTGFVVDHKRGVNGLKEAFKKLHFINSQDCRQHAVQNFSIKKMVKNYEEIYNQLI